MGGICEDVMWVRWDVGSVMVYIFFIIDKY